MPLIPDDIDTGPLLGVIDDLVPPPLHAAAWATCAGPGWFFGHASTDKDTGRFWQMDLDGDAAFDAIWEHARARCEALAGVKLRVIRQYANGHTYGLGGAPHADDRRPGTYTLLYYPNPEWRAGWEGETVYYDDGGEVVFVVQPKPNRAAFFDSRIVHHGRAPSRSCRELRVTVAYKLEALTEAQAGNREPVPIERPVAPPPVEERADGPSRILSHEIDEARIQAGLSARLAELARTIRLPGYPSGQIPEKLLLDRYGERARHDVLRALAVDIIERQLIAEGMIPSECTLHASSRGGGAEIRFAATYLPDVPIGNMTSWAFEKWSAPIELLSESGIEQNEAEVLLAQKLRQDILDKLDEAFGFTILPSLVDRELASIVKEAEALGLTAVDIGGADWKISLSAIAERRLRLGFVIVELARRFSLQAETGPQLETKVCDHVLSNARVDARVATAAELMALSQ